MNIDLSIETLIIIGFIAVIGFAILKRLVWLAVVGAIVVALFQFGFVDMGINFVKDTLIEEPPVEWKEVVPDEVTINKDGVSVTNNE